MDLNDFSFDTLYLDRSYFAPDAFLPRLGLEQSQVTALVWLERLAHDYRAGGVDLDATSWIFTRMVVENAVVHLLVGDYRHLLDDGLGELCAEIVDDTPAPYREIVRFLADAAAEHQDANARVA